MTRALLSGSPKGFATRVLPSATQYGLEWDGTAPGRRQLIFNTPPTGMPMTYVWKVYQREMPDPRGDNRYYCNFFYGHDGAFGWTNTDRGYYGAHPYPIPQPNGTGRWEVAGNQNDYTTRDDGSSPDVVFDQWYDQGFTATESGNFLNYKFWINLPDVTTEWIISESPQPGGWVAPPDPMICFGQTPDNGSGDGWGNFDSWEETDAIIRGIQIYTEELTEAQIVARAALDTNAAVLSLNTTDSITSLWYLNMNPRPSDVTDQSGEGNDPVIEGTHAPSEWSN